MKDSNLAVKESLTAQSPDHVAASGKPIAEQTNTQFMEGYRIGLAEMREKCAKVCETDELCCKCGDECAAAIRDINFEGDTGFRPVSEMIAEHKQDQKKAAAIEKAKMRKAEQKPVAWRVLGEDGEPLSDWIDGKPGEDQDQWESTRGNTIQRAYTHPVRTKDLTQEEIDRLCAAIKAEDDYCVDNGDYMLDSNDCIKIIRGEWVRPDYNLDNAVIAADRKKNK